MPLRVTREFREPFRGHHRETSPADTPLGEAAAACREMATAYLEDGRHFRTEGDTVNALAAFSYGYGWLDAGVRFGLLSVPEGARHLFTSE
jgi:hypothetical protein